jgi:hypothetical protein
LYTGGGPHNIAECGNVVKQSTVAGLMLRWTAAARESVEINS